MARQWQSPSGVYINDPEDGREWQSPAGAYLNSQSGALPDAEVDAAVTLGDIAAAATLSTKHFVTAAVTLGSITPAAALSTKHFFTSAVTLADIAAAGVLTGPDAEITAAVTLGDITPAVVIVGDGVLGEDVPEFGLYGSSYLFPCVESGDEGKIFRMIITSPPVGADEYEFYFDGSLYLAGPDGVYPFTWNLVVNEVVIESGIVSYAAIGDSAMNINVAVTLDSIVAAAALSTKHFVTSAVTLGNISAQARFNRDAAVGGGGLRMRRIGRR